MSTLQRLSPLGVLIIVALFIRLIALNQSLWLDEAITANVVQTYSYTEILRHFSWADFHPPLHYWVERAWGSVLGFSEASLRFPSVLASLIAGYAVYRSGTLLKNETVGLWSAAFFLFNPLMLYYSQEARMYALAVLWIALNFWCWLELKKRFTGKWAVLFALTLGLSFATFYGSAFYVGALGMYALFKREWKLVGLVVLSFSAIFLLLLPLLTQQFAHSREVLAVVPNWSSVLGSATGKNLLLIPVKATSGRISFEPKMLYYSLSGLWLGIVGVFAALGYKHRFLVWMVVAPLGLGLLFSLFSPLLQYFRFLYILIPLSILLGLGTQRFAAARPFLLLGFVAWSLTYLLLPRFHREDWRMLATHLAVSPVPTYMILSASDPLQYYAPSLELRGIQTLAENPPKEMDIAVIPYVTDVHGVPYTELLEQQGYSYFATTTVRGLTFEAWRKWDLFTFTPSAEDQGSN